MPSQKLVRCEIRPRATKQAGTPRFIPLEIFGLWEYLMATKHGFEILTSRRPTRSLMAPVSRKSPLRGMCRAPRGGENEGAGSPSRGPAIMRRPPHEPLLHEVRGGRCAFRRDQGERLSCAAPEKWPSG